ncbi:MAG: hypothetical protein JWR63_2163, partial [Conexibacter sp.]|nr:hypothetical protein [Conexibacter sp.]
GAPRARTVPWTGPAALVAQLRDARAAFGQDWAIVRGPASIAATVGRLVRPRVQLEELPPGVEAHWDSVLAADAGDALARSSPSRGT